MKKTYKKWQKSDVNLDTYLGKEPCEIDEELYLDQMECVSPQYDSGDFSQSGEAWDEINGVFHYVSFSVIDGRFYYLGILPKFKQPKL